MNDNNNITYLELDFSLVLGHVIDQFCIGFMRNLYVPCIEVNLGSWRPKLGVERIVKYWVPLL